MGKKRYVYRSYTTDNLKTRSSIPLQADITEVDAATDYINCNNISLMAVKNLIGEPTFSTAAVCTNTDVNVWSAYGPTKRTVSAGYLVNSVPTSAYGYRLSYFAGYNDNAVAPDFINKNSNTEDFFDGPTTNFTFRCRINIGELTYDDIVGASTATHVAFSVWNGGTWLDYAIKPIGGNGHGQDNGKDILDFDTDAGDRLLVSSINNSTTFTLKIWFLSSDAWEPTGTNKVCQLTQLDDWTHNVYILSANHLYINAPYSGGVPGSISGYTSGEWTLNGGSFDDTDGTYIFTTLAVGNYGTYNHAEVSAWVELGYYNSGGTWNIIESYTQTSPFYDDALVSSGNIGGPWDELVMSGTVPMSHGGYGYRIYIDVEPSTV